LSWVRICRCLRQRWWTFQEISWMCVKLPTACVTLFIRQLAC